MGCPQEWIAGLARERRDENSELRTLMALNLNDYIRYKNLWRCEATPWNEIWALWGSCVALKWETWIWYREREVRERYRGLKRKENKREMVDKLHYMRAPHLLHFYVSWSAQKLDDNV